MYEDIENKSLDELKTMNLSSHDNSYNFPAHYLSKAGNVESLTYVLDRHPIQTVLTNGDGDTPLHLAIKNNQSMAISFLLNRNADYDNCRNRDNKIPLELIKEKWPSITFCNRYSLAETFLEQGTKPVINKTSLSSSHKSVFIQDNSDEEIKILFPSVTNSPITKKKSKK